MESANSGLYSNLRARMNNRGVSSSVTHSEKNEDEMISELQDYRSKAKIQYYRNLLNPEAHVSKVPSRMPVESALASLKYNYDITPNATGKFCLVIDPFYSSGYLYQDNTVNGAGAGVLTALSFPQDGTIIDQWRLTGCSLILKYYGDFPRLGGLFVGATTSNVSAASATTYLTFQNVEDLNNKQVIQCIDGIKLVFCPMDEKATEFNNVATYTGGTHPCRWQYLMVVIGYNFANYTSLRLDYFRNIEYTSTPSVREYINQTRDLPCDTVIPTNVPTVTIAPRDFTSGVSSGTWQSTMQSKVRPPKDSYSDFFSGLVKETVGSAMQSLNPMGFEDTQNKFNTMKDLGVLGGWK
ncbi:MAG: hypothetical protein [Cressdnaviricota sp.]|nr:MAG: hypothetical protein [Cressdnaviricota sp.]